MSEAAEQVAHSPEEAARFRLAAAGDIAVRNELTEENLGLVHQVAEWYHASNAHIDKRELVQEGRIGVMHALKKFNVDKGWKFSTYAMFWIRHYIQRYVVANHSNVSAKKKDIEAYMTGGMTEEEHDHYELCCISNASLDEPMLSGDSFHEVFPDADEYKVDEIAEHGFEWGRARKALLHESVTEKQRMVICMKYGVLGHPAGTVSEIARAVGCSEYAVAKIESEGLAMIHYLLTED